MVKSCRQCYAPSRRDRVTRPPSYGYPMTTEAKNTLTYPEYDENGKPNPVRVPATEDSEEWEIEAMHDGADYDPYDIDMLANEPS